MVLGPPSGEGVRWAISSSTCSKGWWVLGTSERHPPSQGYMSLVYIQIYAEKNSTVNRVSGIISKIIKEELYWVPWKYLCFFLSFKLSYQVFMILWVFRKACPKVHWNYGSIFLASMPRTRESGGVGETTGTEALFGRTMQSNRATLSPDPSPTPIPHTISHPAHCPFRPQASAPATFRHEAW